MSTSASFYPLSISYETQSDVVATPKGSQLLLSLDKARGPVGLRGSVQDPSLLREALMTAIGILESDLRHKSKDRTAYLAYLMKKGKKATAAIWEAQKAFLEESLAEETQKNAVLDPLLTVHPDEVSLEVFSRDESTYARLAFDNALFSGREAAHGSTFIDLRGSFIDKLDKLRTYQPVEVEAGASLPSKEKGETRALEVPYSWLRGFLQVQTAATLPSVSCEFKPIDLYNVLFALRTRKAKKSPRALRFELVPGSQPRIILEPWEIVLEGHGPAYKGKAPRVVRTYGRQRLMVLSRLLPYIKSARAFLVGPGLPIFWVLDLGQASLTLALTGWTESGWSNAASFDALMPAHGASALAEKACGLLAKEGPMSLEALCKSLDSGAESIREALKLACMQGRVLFDLARGVYRPRQLLQEPIDEAKVRYGNQREAQAHRLLGDGKEGEGEVKLTKIHEIAGEGVEISGEVHDRVARRSYITRFMLDLEGRARDASCGCPLFRRSGMKEGPCEHMLALRLTFARRRAEEEAMRQTPEGRKLIRAETRTFVRRDEKGQETVYQVSLDDKVVRLVWGPRTGDARQQRLWFDTDKEARDAYFARLEKLTEEGFIDADMSVA